MHIYISKVVSLLITEIREELKIIIFRFDLRMMGGMKMKRKDLDEVNDDFSGFSLSSPSTKIRRLVRSFTLLCLLFHAFQFPSHNMSRMMMQT